MIFAAHRPCQFTWQDGEFEQLNIASQFLLAPRRLVRQDRKFCWLRREPTKLIHLPDKPARV